MDEKEKLSAESTKEKVIEATKNTAEEITKMFQEQLESVTRSGQDKDYRIAELTIQLQNANMQIAQLQAELKAHSAVNPEKITLEDFIDENQLGEVLMNSD